MVSASDMIPSGFHDIKGKPQSWAMCCITGALSGMLYKAGQGRGLENPFRDLWQGISKMIDEDMIRKKGGR